MMDISKLNRRKVYNKFSGKCAYCGCTISFEDFHCDHIIPKILKGTNNIKNLFPTCCLCNMTKGDLSIKEYRNKIANLPDTNYFNLYQKYYKIKKIPIIFHFEK